MIKFFIRILSIILFCIIGWGTGYLYGIAHFNGYFIQWDMIDSPPIVPSEILSINTGIWVKVTNGEVYYYNDTINCENNCWAKVDSIPPTLEDTLPLEKCNRPSRKKSFIAYQGRCESYGPGGFHVIYYGVLGEGTIYRWEDFSAEGDAIISILAPVIGLVLGLASSIGTVILLYVKEYIGQK